MAGEIQGDAVTTAAGQSGSSASAAPPPDEEVKPYQVHVSTKYIGLTQQKLEITRLPHELSEPNSEDWWEPKPLVEPLIDFWLEQYDWRSEEAILNELPQYRTGFTVPHTEASVRVHFIHARSTHTENAVPLLLIPPFPLTCLSFGHILKSFTEPEDASTNQPFHLVIPSLPGLGFSDALPNNTSVISTTGDILNSLMNRLKYPHYLVTNAGSGSAAPAEIDWKLANHLATQHPDACLGTHFVSPPLAHPKLREAPIEWAKWSIASIFHAPILGYQREDFATLKRNRPVKVSKQSPQPGLSHQLGMREPNTLAYALCDSPTGLLVIVLKGLKLVAPKKEWTPTEIINFTQLSWLPGPEAAMRFWAHSVCHPESSKKRVTTARPRVAITVFLGDEAKEPGELAQNAEAHILPQKESREGYACPSWAKAKYRVVYTQRASGKAGLLAWERPELITTGVRNLAKEVLKLDSRIKPNPAPTAAPLERVGTGDGGNAGHSGGPTAAAAPAAVAPEIGPQPQTPATEVPPILTTNASDSGLLLAPIPEERVQPRREISDETRVASDIEDTKQLLADKSDETLAERPSPKPMSPALI